MLDPEGRGLPLTFSRTENRESGCVTRECVWSVIWVTRAWNAEEGGLGERPPEVRSPVTAAMSGVDSGVPEESCYTALTPLASS